LHIAMVFVERILRKVSRREIIENEQCSSADVSTTDREVPSPHPAHVRNNRILIEYKQSGERQQEKVAHGNMEEALCKPPVQSSCRSVRVYSLLLGFSLLFSSLLFSLSFFLSPFLNSPSSLFPRKSVSTPFYPPVILPRRIYGAPPTSAIYPALSFMVYSCTRILTYKPIHTHAYIRTHRRRYPMLRGGHVRSP